MDEPIKDGQGVTGFVECAVEGDGERAGSSDEAGYAGSVETAIRRQTPEDDAICAAVLRVIDGLRHRGHFVCCVDEVAAARADHHHDGDGGQGPCAVEKIGPRGDPAELQRCAQFDAICSRTRGDSDVVEVVDADL